MTEPADLAAEHESLTRRYFMQIGAAGAALTSSALWAEAGELPKAVRAAVAKMEYLTPPDKFRMFGRVNSQKNDYGHNDIVIGIHAKKEVYPTILDWLDEHPCVMHEKELMLQPGLPPAESISETSTKKTN